MRVKTVSFSDTPDGNQMYERLSQEPHRTQSAIVVQSLMAHYRIGDSQSILLMEIQALRREVAELRELFKAGGQPAASAPSKVVDKRTKQALDGLGVGRSKA